MTKKVCVSCKVKGTYAELYDQDFSDQPPTLINSAAGLGNSGTITGTDYSIDWVVNGDGVITVNEQNQTAGVSAGVASQWAGRVTITTDTLATAYGDVVIRVRTVNNTEDDLYVQRLFIYEDCDELFLQVGIASDQADVRGNEDIYVSYSINEGVSFSPEVSVTDQWSLESGVAGANQPIPDGSFTTLKIADKPQECENVCSIVTRLAAEVADLKATQTPLLELVEVETSNLFHASVNPVDIHNNGNALAITQTRVDTGWTSVANGADYAGSPDSVEVTVNVQVDENAASNYWALPEIIVTRNGTRIGAASAILMQNNGTYSNQSTLAAHIVDPDPGTDPEYRFLLEDADNRTNAAVPQDHAHVALRAIHKVQAYAPSSTGGPTTTTTTPTTPTTPDYGTPANGLFISDNFQDGNGNAPFNLQVRINGAGPEDWRAVVAGPYATIPNLSSGNYTLQTTDNGDGSYTHVFTGTVPLANFNNIIITGGLPVPAGAGGTANVALYIP